MSNAKQGGKNKKQGGKNKKIGRHSRNPSSKLQAMRTARNKAKRGPSLPATYPKPRPLTREEIRAAERVTFTGPVPRQKGIFWQIHPCGQVLDVADRRNMEPHWFKQTLTGLLPL